MKNFLLFFLLAFPLCSQAHPGIGIVKDSKGNIYYSDLNQVWKISNGRKSVVVPHVHTHELYVDTKDNLYGEHLIYEAGPPAKWYHYLWALRPDGRLDTVVNLREAYLRADYSLARDPAGNEYYTKQFTQTSATRHIYKRPAAGKESVFATGDFKGLRWLHPQKDGSLLYVQHNNVYKINPQGESRLLAKEIGNKTPSFSFSGNAVTVWGVWPDSAGNVYAAVFSDQVVRKIQPDGQVVDYYKSGGNWAPAHGIFDNSGQLWLMESSDKNEIRVIAVPAAKVQDN